MDKTTLTNEQIEQAVSCCSKQDCTNCPLKEMFKNPPLLCFDILFPNLVKYIERTNNALAMALKLNKELEADKRLANVELQRLNSEISKLQGVFYAQEVKAITDCISVVADSSEKLKAEYEKLKSDLWVLQEENRELKKDKDRLKAHLRGKNG